MEKLQNRLIELWHEPIALVLVLVAVFLALVYFFSGVNISSIPIVNLAIYLLVVLAIFLLWYLARRPPRARLNRIGIVIAISAETDEQRLRIQKDFIAAMKSSLEGTSEIIKLDFVELPRWHTEKVGTSADRASEYVAKCRAHLLIFGTPKVRTINKKEIHVLNLRQIIVHRPVPTDTSKELSQEMAAIFSPRINIDRENDLVGLELASTWLAEAAKYFVGVAAYMSGDLDLSKMIFEELRASKHLASLRGIPGVAKLRQLVPQRLADVYLASARRSYLRWRKTRFIADLDDSNANIENYNRIHPNTYQYRLSKAIWLFVARHDVPGAIHLVEKAKGESDAAWRYSLAFLYAYQGRHDEAVWQYNKAFTRPCEQSLPFEVEEFIEWVLEQEPDKFQLHFCIGLINWSAKGDRERATKDFELFAAHRDAAKYPNMLKEAERYITEFRIAEASARIAQ